MQVVHIMLHSFNTQTGSCNRCRFKSVLLFFLSVFFLFLSALLSFLITYLFCSRELVTLTKKALKMYMKNTNIWIFFFWASWHEYKQPRQLFIVVFDLMCRYDRYRVILATKSYCLNLVRLNFGCDVQV